MRACQNHQASTTGAGNPDIGQASCNHQSSQARRIQVDYLLITLTEERRMERQSHHYIVSNSDANFNSTFVPNRLQTDACQGLGRFGQAIAVVHAG